jgi:hypothetical protein
MHVCIPFVQPSACMCMCVHTQVRMHTYTPELLYVRGISSPHIAYICIYTCIYVIYTQTHTTLHTYIHTVAALYAGHFFSSRSRCRMRDTACPTCVCDVYIYHIQFIKDGILVSRSKIKKIIYTHTIYTHIYIHKCTCIYECVCVCGSILNVV